MRLIVHDVLHYYPMRLFISLFIESWDLLEKSLGYGYCL